MAHRTTLPQTPSGSTSDGFAPITLPPQQTPFVPTVPCTLSVHCPFMSNLLYSVKSSLNRHPLSGQRCQAFYTTTDAQVDHIQEIEACLPDGYRQLNGQTVLGLDSFLLGGHPQLFSTEAYPGTACMQGWTSACSQIVDYDDSFSTHTWCCPNGSWECQASAKDFEGWMTGHRLCRSVMTEATDVWMSFDPPADASDSNHLVYTWHRSVTAEPLSQFAARIYHHAMPLDGLGATSSSEAQDPISTSPSIGIVSTSNYSPPSALTTGEVCGVAIGATSLVLLMVVAALYCGLPCLRKMRHQPGQERKRRRLSIQTTSLQDKATADLSSGSIFGVFPRAELDADPTGQHLAYSRDSRPEHRRHETQGPILLNSRLPTTDHAQPPGPLIASNTHIHELQG